VGPGQLVGLFCAVLSGWVLVRPLKSYALSPRTLQLKTIAKTLQRNAVDARAAANSETYRGFLNDLRGCFEEPESKDVRVSVCVAGFAVKRALSANV
jgi:hypothetical protein